MKVLWDLKGENMELLNLDTTNGVIKIKGKVNSYVYLEKTNKKEESIIARLFK